MEQKSGFNAPLCFIYLIILRPKLMGGLSIRLVTGLNNLIYKKTFVRKGWPIERGIA
jgi:hypothetical protein